MYNINIKTHICLKRGVNKADQVLSDTWSALLTPRLHFMHVNLLF